MSEREQPKPPRLFRLILRLYPKDFREAYGEEMDELVRRRLERASAGAGGTLRTRMRVLRVWLRVIRDVFATALPERLERARRNGRRDPPSTERERPMSAMWRALLESTRRLARSPGFTLAAAAVVALGIGANATVFTLVDTLLFRPPPFEEPERLVRVYQDSDDGEPSSTSFPAYRDMTAFEAFTGVTAVTDATLTWETDEGPRLARVELVTQSHFPVLGLEPSLGSWFDPEHDQVGVGAFAVVSHRTWVQQMGADPSLLGSAVRLNGQPVTLLGVGPEGYHGSGRALVTDFWLSISSVGVADPYYITNLDRREDHWYDVQARLAPGVSVAQAQAAMDALAARLADDFPDLNRGRDITVFPLLDVRLHPDDDAELYPGAWLLLGISGMVLLLACSNLANLLLVRGIARGPEVAVRRALGASRGGVTGLFLTEAVLLSLLGGGVGLLVARWAIDILPSLPLPFPSGADLALAIDGRVLIFTLTLVLFTSLLFGLVPALRANRTDVAYTLRVHAGATPDGRRISLYRGSMVAVQVAVSLVLVIGTGLLLRSLGNLQAVAADPGMDAGRVAFVQASFSQAGVPAPEVANRTAELVARIEALPGVSGVTIVNQLPAGGRSGTSTTVVEGYEPPSGTGAVELPYRFVGPDYFEVLGIPVLAGRSLTRFDANGPEPVALLNETAASRFWPGQDPIGRRIRGQSNPDGWIRIVGVVADTKVRSLSEPPTPLVYRPTLGLTTPFLLVRTEGAPAALVQPLRRMVTGAPFSLPITALGSLDSFVSAGLAGPRVATLLLGGFTVLAMLLAGLGIYAVVSFTVARRSAELGIRIALGAAHARVLRTVMLEALVGVGLGLLGGGAVALVVASRLEGELFQVDGLDPGAFAIGAVMLAAVASLAAYLPARRAVRADPVEALRAR